MSYYISSEYFEELKDKERQMLFGKIPSADLRDYTKLLGWNFLTEAIKDKIFVANNPKFDKRQINFPIEGTAPDYAEAIELAISKVAELQGKTIANVIAEIQELKDDTLRFRVIDTRNEDSFIPLSYAVSAINGAKELFVSAACSVLKPQAHHPRMNRSEALELIEKSRFRHTEKGSFILKVSSPLKAVDIQANLFSDETMPFVRQTTLTINTGLNQLVTAIQADTLIQLVDEIKDGSNHYISSNLCKAVTNFQEQHEDFDLWVDFNFAGSLALPSTVPVVKEVKIQKDYFSRIDDVRRELRNTEQQKKKEDVFMATVEHLAGEIGDDGLRSGEVILNLYQEDEIIKAKTGLNSVQYIEADKAHMTSGAYIKIKGKLHPGNQPRSLTDVSLFELILP
ncbi:MAG: hypothetical protein QM530_03730 [Phycisphaerales bacterium]|nr:hypothetical protein [Phycisphaerales bacterium]